jgi:phosphohistidine phosphatase
MQLYLIRHAEPVSKTEDPSQPLSAVGLETIDKMAGQLAKSRRCRPREIRHSTKLRARQTAERLALALGQVPLREMDGLAPLDDVEPIAEALVYEGNDLMLVGHLPHLNRLASLLVAGDEDAGLFSFQPAAAVCLQQQGESGTGKWVLGWMIPPDLLS